jgi:hypothetical protein
MLDTVGRAAASPNFTIEDITMPAQLVTAEDRQNYGDELIDMSQRAAMDVVAPELQRLHAENQQLRHQQQPQNSEIQRTLDQSVPDWREVYADPAFAQWLAQPDDYSGGIRSQLLRNAVANGDAHRVAAIYKGFTAEHGAPGARSYSRGSTPAAGRGGKPIYSREQIKQLYAQRARGLIPNAKWGAIEADIIAAANEGRVTSSFDKYGNEMRLR